MNLFKRLWGGKRDNTAWQPLQRSAHELNAYAQWVQEGVYLRWLGPFFKAYHYQKAGFKNCRHGLQAQLLSGCGQQGTLLFYDDTIGPDNFRHLFDFIRDQVQAQGYQPACSDVRIRRHPRYVETISKHFLKPRPCDCPETGRCQQRYGTVSVDLVHINGQPGFIRLVTNAFDDSMFSPPRSFDELMEAVFNVQPSA